MGNQQLRVHATKREIKHRRSALQSPTCIWVTCRFPGCFKLNWHSSCLSLSENCRKRGHILTKDLTGATAMLVAFSNHLFFTHSTPDRVWQCEITTYETKLEIQIYHITWCWPWDNTKFLVVYLFLSLLTRVICDGAPYYLTIWPCMSMTCS